MSFGPDGNFYVTGYNNNAVLCYQRDTGAFLRVFTRPGGTIQGAWGITFTLPKKALAELDLPTSIPGGQAAQGKVVLAEPAPGSGAFVWLSADKPVVSVPSFVTIPAGKKSATFPITTILVAKDTTVSVTANYVRIKITAKTVVKSTTH
jgi:hypothetical protein